MARRLCLVFIVMSSIVWGQEYNSTLAVDANYFYGTIVRHNKDISHLIKGHPEGFILSLNKQTFGKKEWQQRYNFPDYGASILYQDTQSESLGKLIGLYAHYNFYFLKRNLQFRIGTGITYATSPYDIDDNFDNNAYGSTLLNGTYLMLNYHRKNIFKGIGIQAGISAIHYSNANFKAPNSSTNSIVANLGLNYQLDTNDKPVYNKEELSLFKKQPIHINIVFRGGINESDYIGLGQRPFYVLSTYLDKRLGHKSAVQLGAEFFHSKFLETEIDYLSIAFPNAGVQGDEDYKRVGVFAGHELHINKLSVLFQVGYYVYYPYDFEGRVYLRPGLKYYLTNSLFTAVTLKSHGAKAEAVEFGLGIRL